MSHNAYIRAIGTWTTGSTVTAANFEAIGLQLYQSINGDLGGTWAPSAQIEIGGAGLRVSATFELYYGGGVSNGLTFNGTTGALTVNTNITSAGDNVWQGVNQFTSDVEFDGGTLTCVGATVTFDATTIVSFAAGSAVTDHAARTVDGTWTVTGGSWAFSGGHTVTTGVGAGVWTFNNTLDLKGAVALEGATTITGAVALQNKVTLSGNGRMRWRYLTGAIIDTTYAVTDADIIYIPALAANITYTLTAGTASSGEMIMVLFGGGATYHVNVTDSGAGLVATMGQSAGEKAWACFVFNGSQWILGPYLQN